jgi:hypothetical protein
VECTNAEICGFACRIREIISGSFESIFKVDTILAIDIIVDDDLVDVTYIAMCNSVR